MATVSILGIASAIPHALAPPAQYDRFARKWAKPSAALDKTLHINNNTGITQRPSVHDESAPILNRPSPSPIQDVVAIFLDLGGRLALTASQDAITDWGRPASEITHLICTTCTGSSHPGYDLHLHQQLGLPSSVERTLIHGIGCAGGLSIIRLARNICIAAEAQGRKARCLVVALEVTSTLVRTELASLDEEAERGGTRPNVASTIFSDAASAMVVGSGELEEGEHQSFEVLECLADTVEGTDADLAFHIQETGWRAVLTTRVPTLTARAVPALFIRLLTTFSPSPSSSLHTNLSPSTPANQLDWAIHTGGSLILSTLSKTLSLASPADDPSQTKPSWQMYKERGNASSASIGGVIERGRLIGGREGVVAVAFGPGVTVEMCLLRRAEWRGRKAEEGEEVGVSDVGDVPGMGNVGRYDKGAKVEGIVEAAGGRVNGAGHQGNGESQVDGDKMVNGQTKASADKTVNGDKVVNGDSKIDGESKVNGDIQVDGERKGHGEAKVDGQKLVNGKARSHGEGKLNGESNGQGANAQVTGKSATTGVEEGDFEIVRDPARKEAEVGRCTCRASTIRFGGSGLDCWCRS